MSRVLPWIHGAGRSGRALRWAAKSIKSYGSERSTRCGLHSYAHLNGEDGLWRWREDGIATGTESALNIASMFVPSGGAAAGALRTGSLGARLLRITTGAADFIVPGASALTYGGIRVISRLETAISRLDDIPVVQPTPVGAAGEVLDAADLHTHVIERPVSDELFSDGVGVGDGVDLDIVNGQTSPAAAPPVQVDRTEYASTVSVQKQDRHVLDAANHEPGKSYFTDAQQAQAVLDAFHNGSAEILGFKSNGDVVVRVDGITGYYCNERWGLNDQPTNVFFIKGTVYPSVVPYNPGWTPTS